ncbi:M48 family metallopeptidase [Exilibacterium tricleocarpae]|uniref:M48 family metallopeptidase n=1 Tax=Exilibacterium tricleocarpae TaxID=2591008 RepID=A0A545TFP0_9GAMM|nr:SprT family zinc-dependent metalloprotease [Exilibacterium tricleocarpae]TQV76018.1 M48 family metallopeptidase [Exilibacterium tricleocarpae]
MPRRLARLQITEIPVPAKALLGYDYILKLSPRRRSISLEVDAGGITVRAPKGVDQRQLQAWLLQRRDWVLQKQRQLQVRSSQIVAPEYVEGGRFRWLGESYRLVLRSARRTAVDLQGDQLLVTCGSRAGGEAWLRRVLADWYRDRALALLTEKTHACARRLGVSVAAVTLRLTKTKWGHCTRAGKIQFNWLIVLAPEPVVDYLVVHEVCHRRYLDHSAAYWRLVESLCPDYRRHRQWLREWGHTLIL